MKGWAKILIILVILAAIGVVLYAMGRDEEVATTTADMFRVTAPVANAVVRSPLTVSGEARGNWYFEASFPVRILDANGKELGVIPAQAQGEWMTTNFVPFSISLSFATSTTATGVLVLQKDNPSGLPEHDASVRIPVRFR